MAIIGKDCLLHLVVEKKGKPLWITTTGANGNEREQALVLLDELQIAQCKNNQILTTCEADKGYDSDDTKQEMLYRGYLPIIGYRKNRKEKVETQEIYEFFKLEKFRWVVERCFSWLKQKSRRILMRWERIPGMWESFVKLSFISGSKIY
jgi:transposase